jgi:hypothetical protein
MVHDVGNPVPGLGYEQNCGGLKPVDQGMLIIEFKNKQCAQLWLDSDRKFRNKEWPSASSSLEIIMDPLLYKPPKSKLNILKFVTNHFYPYMLSTSMFLLELDFLGLRLYPLPFSK